MQNVTYKSYFMKEEELYLILSGLGKNQWFGIQSGQDVSLERVEDVHRVLAALYQKDVIDFRNDKVVLKKPFKTIFDVFVKSNCCVLAVKTNEIFRARTIYIYGNHTVMVQNSIADANTLEMTLIQTVDLIPVLIEENFFVETIQEDDLIINEDLMKTIDQFTFMDFAVIDDLVSLFEKIDLKTGNPVSRMIIEDQDICTAMYIQTLKMSECVSYNKDLFTTVLKQWIEE